ncbi:pyridoxal-5-phosphate-dependent protein subunit beta [Lachnospiraceae bacterium ASD5720]|uniref:Pyridoxal-5-phosphate-dependent protein subunit beta n=1 Tax=Diplocloster agilis TaxID=2850323 RepID=A0A949NI17_9FIRM|nr:pyridoxal-5-phosphate-dependent protein subunit beta [Diplocloster agilis]MBU9737025.1 pyridoxal-5-phosphate-dependent protein subunit beta [Diplocloster agilis]
MNIVIDLTKKQEALARNIERAKEKNIIIPTFEQMRNPEKVPEAIKEQLKSVGLWDINPLNLFRITWKNEPKESGGLFGGPNFIVLPKELTGVDAKILCMIGKFFPTGCHKVGASFGCLAPRLVTGQFDASRQKAVWPSTGNYCRGGAFNSKLLSCDSIAILPAEMSRERFDWLATVATEIIATPGCESNVKEIFDKTWELRNTRDDVMIFNQFEEMGNHLWHYAVTGNAIEEAYLSIANEKSHLAGACFTSGSAGTTGTGDYLKEKYPGLKLGVGEALQCPTLLNNGFGGHRIEGIGDKHVPWIHNVKNTDMVIAIDDEDSQKLLRLFNEPEGREYLVKEAGVDPKLVDELAYMGISGIANVLCAIKMAKYYELTENDVVATVLTDSAAMYGSRIEELREEDGEYSTMKAAVDYHTHLRSVKTDNLEELTYTGRKRIHNLKYYTWVEQQGRTVEELNALWYDYENTWGAVHKQAAQIDELIKEFNESTGLLKNL